MLDDIVGFVGDEECREFAVPYLIRIFKAFDARVRFFHNDAQGLVSTPYLEKIGVNLFNFSFEHSLVEIRESGRTWRDTPRATFRPVMSLPQVPLKL